MKMAELQLIQAGIPYQEIQKMKVEDVFSYLFIAEEMMAKMTEQHGK